MCLQMCQEIIRKRKPRFCFAWMCELFNPLKPCDSLFGEMRRMNHPCDSCGSKPLDMWPLQKREPVLRSPATARGRPRSSREMPSARLGIGSPFEALGEQFRTGVKPSFQERLTEEGRSAFQRKWCLKLEQRQQKRREPERRSTERNRDSYETPTHARSQIPRRLVRQQPQTESVTDTQNLTSPTSAPAPVHVSQQIRRP